MHECILTLDMPIAKLFFVPPPPGIVHRGQVALATGINNTISRVLKSVLGTAM